MQRKRRLSQASYSDSRSPQHQRNSFLTVSSTSCGISSPSSLSERSISPTPAPQVFASSGVTLDAWSTDQVCFGALNDLKILLKWAPRSIDLSFEAGPLDRDGHAIRVLNFGFHVDYCLVHTTRGDAVGTLEEKAFLCLKPLAMGGLSIQFEVLVSESEWQSKITSIHNRKGQQIPVHVEVFGPRTIAHDVARHLGKARVFLQQPRRLIGPPYENPQCLEIHVAEVHDNDNENSNTWNDADRTRAGPQSMNDSQDTEDLIPDLDQIIYGLYQEDDIHFGDLQVDPRITTTLLRHQVTALKFILGRESGLNTENRNLWDPLGQDDENIGYRHAITGARSRTADDSPGGIIADEMGLGKTLTMLSAILTSLPNACEYAMSSDLADTGVDAEEGRLATGRPHYMKGTLVVVPSELLLTNWIEEIKRHAVEDSVSYYKYHGKDRHKDASSFCNYEIVFTTYGTIAAEAAKGKSILETITWYRIILDEAHTIRNWTTKQFTAVRSLQAHIRWCMTGTPIQNKLDDLGALVRFLRIPILEDVVIFRRYISSEAEWTKDRAPDFSNLRLLLQYICLRRSKSLLGVNSRTETIRPCFSEAERCDYRTLEVVFREAILKAANTKRSKASHQNVLEKLLRLREFCNGIHATENGRNVPERIFSMIRQTGETTCSYCTVAITDIDVEGTAPTEDDTKTGCSRVCLTECQRFVCGDSSCLSQYTGELGSADGVNGRHKCPFCGVHHGTTNLLGRESKRSSAEEMELDSIPPTSYPSKLLSLLEDVKLHIDQEKCIIFSVWKRTLSLVERLLSEHRIRYCRVDGSVSTTNKRKRILLGFQENPELKVLLMTLGTGAVGLNNLSVASRIHLLEPQWNPSVERQAIGRVLRLGQHRDVKIIRYIMKNSIEEVHSWKKLVEGRQLRKLHVASGGFDIAKLVQEGLAGYDLENVAMLDN